jgi:hypothetical protein
MDGCCLSHTDRQAGRDDSVCGWRVSFSFSSRTRDDARCMCSLVRVKSRFIPPSFATAETTQLLQQQRRSFRCTEKQFSLSLQLIMRAPSLLLFYFILFFWLFGFSIPQNHPPVPPAHSTCLSKMALLAPHQPSFLRLSSCIISVYIDRDTIGSLAPV